MGLDGNQGDDSAYSSGAVYVFARRMGNWAQENYVKASDTDTGDGFGWAVSMAADGRTFVVGAGGESSSATGINGAQADDSAATSGAAYLFAR